MDEIKNKTEQLNAQQGNSGGGRKRRRHRGGKGNKGNNQNGENRAQQPQSAQAPQNPQNNQNGNKPKGDKQKNRQEKNAQPQQNNQKQSQKQQPKQPQPQKQNNAQNGNKQKGNKPEKQEKQDKREENRKDTYVYTLDGNLYINLTNKCSNACDFCVRNERSSYYGNYLWLKNGDPTVEKVIAAANGFGDLSRFNEVVFCGFGEPTYKVAEMVALCDFFHEKGLKTRLNTNGQGNLINKRDIVPDLKDKIDFVNISLNASCYEKYQPICRSQFKEAGFEGMIEFAKLCRRNGVNCRFSIVDCIGEEEVAACKCLADSVKIPLYVRKYITDS
ncbi:MAG: radical SAM protein [Clostridia bacterium]|nr:radical SAM protein [Clostridia bacterium]